MKAILLASLLLLTGALSGCNKKDVHIGFVESVSTNIIAPGYQMLFLDASQLAQVSTQCEAKEVDYRQIVNQLKRHWRNTMASWQGVQWVQFGPIKEEGREWSLQFWPDKRNLVGKKINALMKNAELVTEESLVRGGVLTQGLSALEYILFDRLENNMTDSEVNNRVLVRQACLSSIAVAQSIKQTSKVLLEGWDEYQRENFKQLDKPNANADIVDVQQAISLIINNVIAVVDVMQNKKLGSPFSLESDSVKKSSLNYIDVKKANAFFLESWRSQNSRSNLNNNVNALLALFGDKSFKRLMATQKQEGLALLLEKSVTNISNAIQATEGDASYFEQISTNKLNAAKNIKPLYEEFIQLKLLMVNDLTRVLGVQAGFNANDGDS